MTERPQKLLVANRGEIAVRVLRAAKELGIDTVAIYTPSDSTSPHVLLADTAVALSVSTTELQAYLSAGDILDICKAHNVTLLHPGYGFLSENDEFAAKVVEHGITWLGPRPNAIKAMGLKHEARAIAQQANVPVVPGSDGVLSLKEDEACAVAERVGFPVILKASAGGGGMGMAACSNLDEFRQKLPETRARAKILFGNEQIFLERFFPQAKHIEVQVFGNGLGHVAHMGERECSAQRRHQKIIEESPSAFFDDKPDLRTRICTAAVDLCRSINYSSAGTVEFLVDALTGDFYFLEMNTRIQVEHPVTEATRKGLDLIKLMIQQGIAEGTSAAGLKATDFNKYERPEGAAIEVRVYAENPFRAFQPSSGVLQYVDLATSLQDKDWLRVDSWIATGTSVSPFFDPLLCKLVVHGADRREALQRLVHVLDETKICGPPNNIEFLKNVVQNEILVQNTITTRILDTYEFIPSAMTITSAGLEASIQDYPGRLTQMGLPRSGPMDSLAFRAANILAGNPDGTEGLEVIVVPGLPFECEFHVPAVIAVTGQKNVSVQVNDAKTDPWCRISVLAGDKLCIDVEEAVSDNAGFRVYIALRGGFPAVAPYLGSKSTSMGLGGYQGRALLPGDQLSIESHEVGANGSCVTVPASVLPVYDSDWIMHVLRGPQDDDEYLTPAGRQQFYETKWKVSPSSNRMGVRLESPGSINLWARESGGEGGSHPSNILDNGYAFGSVNVNGETPVILTNEGPDMGGYVCVCTIASADRWKVGQLRPGSTIQFRPISFGDSLLLEDGVATWLGFLQDSAERSFDFSGGSAPSFTFRDDSRSPILRITNTSQDSKRPRTVFRQAGDSAILVEFGPMTLDLTIIARIHAFESELGRRNVAGIIALCRCVRSTMCHYDHNAVSQKDLLDILLTVEETLPASATDMHFPSRRISFPIVLDDPWNKEALEQYMRTTRNKAVYLPSNVEYLARNNGLDNAGVALQKLIGSDWLVCGVGFYLACPFLVPIDPRCRLVGQKMNPSRTFTPRGAIGIAGVVAAIYPIESPGGYQLYARTLPTWSTWSKGVSFKDAPWLLRPFDKVHFEPISEGEYAEIEKAFDAGQYAFKTENTTFSMAEYLQFAESVAAEVQQFKQKQAIGTSREEKREAELLKAWEREKAATQENQKKDQGMSLSINEGLPLLAPLFASVWKIKVSPGSVVINPDDVVVILEAMKTEIPLKAGRRFAGRTVKGLGQGIKEGSTVSPGTPILYFA